MTSVRSHPRHTVDLAQGVKHGAIGGIVAGVTVPMFEMAMAAC